MKRVRLLLAVFGGLLSNTVAPLNGQVFSSEFFADPVSEGWDQLLSYCEPDTWNDDGLYFQQLDLEACPPGPGGGREVFRRSLEPYDGTSHFFTEFRLLTDGDRSEISFGGPALLVLGNNAGVLYHMTVARDQVKFLRDVDLPIWFVEIQSGVPHTFRIELWPDRYTFFIDTELIDEGGSDGPFPTQTPRVTWQGNSQYVPCQNTWDYIRYGVIPDDASGDYDSDGGVGLFDYYFVHDCLTRDGPGIFAGPGQNAGPGCRFIDFDADADTDLLDFAEFANQFTGPLP